jgi:hypothetical protein
VLMTPRAYQSEWVQNELSRAKRKQKAIFPLLLRAKNHGSRSSQPSILMLQTAICRQELFTNFWRRPFSSRVISAFCLTSSHTG